MPVNLNRANAIGKAAGYEGGYFWGKITGGVGGTLGFIAVVGLGTVGAPLVLGAAAAGGVGLLVGGTVGGKVGAFFGTTAAENELILNPESTERDLRKVAESRGAEVGAVAGGVAGVAVGAALGSAVNHGLVEVVDKKIGEAVASIEGTPVPQLALGVATLAGSKVLYDGIRNLSGVHDHVHAEGE